MHLPTAQPFDGAAVLAFLAARAIGGVEDVRDGTYRRTLTLPHGGAILKLTPRPAGVEAAFTLDDARDKPAAIAAARALFGLDADPAAVAAVLGADPHLAPLVAARPGLRVPGAVDGWELAVRAVLGQQITVAAARTLATRITAAIGAPLEHPDGALTHRFPTAAARTTAPDATFPMPRSRARALRELAAAGLPLATPGDAAALLDVWGVGPWTAGYVALRLGDPDVFLPGDVAVVRALRERGLTVDHASRWNRCAALPWSHLWASLADAAAPAAV